jgi:hypothetical protein
MEQKVMIFAVDDNSYLPNQFKEEVNADYVRYIAGFSGKIPFRGITIDEERKMPLLWQKIGADPKSQDWSAKSNDFFTEWETKIPVGKILPNNKIENTLEINAGYEEVFNDKKELIEIRPYNIDDFILYRIIKADSTTSRTLDDLTQRVGINYFVIDVADVIAAQKESTKDRMQITKLLAELSAEKDTDRLKQIIKVYSKLRTAIEVETFSKLECIDALYEMAEKEKEEFIKACEDKNLIVNARIFDYLNSEALVEQDGAYFIEQIKIANNKGELLVFLSREENRVRVNALDTKTNYYKQNEVLNVIV